MDAPLGLATRRFGCGIDRGTWGQFRPPLGKFADQLDVFAFAWLPAWASGKAVWESRWELGIRCLMQQ